MLHLSLHGKLYFPDMKVSEKHTYVYLYLTNIYVFVCTRQMDIVLNYNIATKHWWDMPSLQQEIAVIQLQYTM